jgi:hypothetical protein
MVSCLLLISVLLPVLTAKCYTHVFTEGATDAMLQTDRQTLLNDFVLPVRRFHSSLRFVYSALLRLYFFAFLRLFIYLSICLFIYFMLLCCLSVTVTDASIIERNFLVRIQKKKKKKKKVVITYLILK